MRSDSIIQLLDAVLDTYVIDAEQLYVCVCDNASVDIAIAKEVCAPMIGCAGHGFNLAVQLIMGEHREIL